MVLREATNITYFISIKEYLVFAMYP